MRSAINLLSIWPGTSGFGDKSAASTRFGKATTRDKYSGEQSA
jgi:hypothetical protein